MFIHRKLDELSTGFTKAELKKVVPAIRHLDNSQCGKQPGARPIWLSIESALADKIQERKHLKAEKEVQEHAVQAIVAEKVKKINKLVAHAVDRWERRKTDLVADSMLVTADLRDTIEDLTAEAMHLEHTLAEQQVILESLPASIDPNTLDTDELLALLAKRGVMLAKHPYCNGRLNPSAENTLAPMQSQSDGSFHNTLRQLFCEAAAVALQAVHDKMAKLALCAAHGQTKKHAQRSLSRSSTSLSSAGGAPHASRKGRTLADHHSAHRARSSRSSRSSSSRHASPPHSDDDDNKEVQMPPAAQHRPSAAQARHNTLSVWEGTPPGRILVPSLSAIVAPHADDN
ncbi:hypothetical protein B0H19DRAFT_1064942 [Mycena capillaripes]|nr:hypothetical protein B0H19DRAFT_1064942 [Mycena capillaripes]